MQPSTANSHPNALAARMRDELSFSVQRISCRQPNRPQTGNADRIRAALPLRKLCRNKHKRLVVQIIEACRITLQHALELAACRGQVSIEVQHWVRACWIPPSTGPLCKGGIQRIFPVFARDP